jgi:hypothetical protein
MTLDNKNVLIGLGAIVVLLVLYLWWTKKPAQPQKDKSPAQRENFTYDQVALNAKNYTFIPSKNCNGCLPRSQPDFASITCNSNGDASQRTQQAIDLNYRKPVEMLEVADLLPETDISGLSFATDPSDDFANKFVWHRTTNARVKRRNWETGAAMIRGDLIIDPGKQSWFQHDNDFRDLTPGFIPKNYCGEIDVEDLSYNMNKAV